MFEKQNKLHLEAIDKMKTLMQSPNTMQNWFATKRDQFNSLSED